MGEDSSNLTQISLKISNEIKGTKEIDEYIEKLQQINGYINSIKTGQKNSFRNLKNELNGVEKNINKNIDASKKFEKKLSQIFNVAKVIAFGKTLKVMGQQIMKLTKYSADYVENVNLLEVAYARIDKKTGEFLEDIEDSSARIEGYIKKMSDAFSFDESRLTRSFGIFKQLANAMELPDETSEQLSEHLVKMSNDIASLYNLDLDRASNALQSALAGQVRPIRTATGADITEKTLQKTIDALGLDRSISQLSFVEKRLIMVISLTEQLKKSQGDYARTINSVANQTRILGEQWDRLARAVGNSFYPILETVLPYLNAILIVLTEIFNLVAGLLGFKMPDFDYSSLAGMSDLTADLIDEMDGLGESVDETKNKVNGLRSFDKLNNITSPKDSSSSSAGVGGIDPEILDAFYKEFASYKDGMDEINNKAKEIADKILDWLGFTDGTYKNLKLIAGIIGTLVGLSIISKITTLIELISAKGGILKIISNGTLAKNIKSIGTLLSKLLSPTGLVIVGIVAVVTALIHAYKTNEEFRKKVDDFVKTLKQSLEPVLNAIMDILKDIWNDILKPLWEDVIYPLGKFLFDVFIGIIETLMEILKPLFKNVISPLATLLFKVLEFFIKPVTTAIRIICEILGEVFKVLDEIYQFLKPFIDWVVKKIIEHIKPAIESIGNVINTIKNAIQGLLDWWNSLSFNKKKIEVEGRAYGEGGEGSFGGGGGGTRANGGVLVNGNWQDITSYATGTQYAPVGQMFIAREKGPELVGNLGSHTAVMNNDQIVASVSDGVFKAVSMANNTQQKQPQIFNLYLDENHKLGTYTIEQLQDMAKTNGKPIMIGG